MKKIISYTILTLFVFNLMGLEYIYSSQEGLDISSPDEIQKTVVLEDNNEALESQESDEAIDRGQGSKPSEMIRTFGEKIISDGGEFISEKAAALTAEKKAAEGEIELPKKEHVKPSQPEFPKKVQAFHKKIANNEKVLSVKKWITEFFGNIWKKSKDFFMSRAFVQKFIKDYSGTSVRPAASNIISEDQSNSDKKDKK